MRGVVVMGIAFVSLVSLFAIACVDGTTPDCSTPASGCFPGDGGSSEASTDGATDAAKDADTDGESDAGDASLVTDANPD